METITALSTLNLLPSTREQVQSFIRLIKSEILSANKPLNILVQLKMAEKTIADLLKDDELDQYFLKELLFYSEKEQVTINGAKLNQQETGVKYFYEDCGDMVYFDLIKQQEELKEKIKERETYLKNIPAEGTVCPINGNFITRPGRTSKSKVVVKLL
jgi:hypothetical protein